MEHLLNHEGAIHGVGRAGKGPDMLALSGGDMDDIEGRSRPHASTIAEGKMKDASAAREDTLPTVLAKNTREEVIEGEKERFLGTERIERGRERVFIGEMDEKATVGITGSQADHIVEMRGADTSRGPDEDVPIRTVEVRKNTTHKAMGHMGPLRRAAGQMKHQITFPKEGITWSRTDEPWITHP